MAYTSTLAVRNTGGPGESGRADLVSSSAAAAEAPSSPSNGRLRRLRGELVLGRDCSAAKERYPELVPDDDDDPPSLLTLDAEALYKSKRTLRLLLGCCCCCRVIPLAFKRAARVRGTVVEEAFDFEDEPVVALAREEESRDEGVVLEALVRC